MSRLLKAVQEATPEEVAELLAPVGCQSFKELYEKVSTLEQLQESDPEPKAEEKEEEEAPSDEELEAEEDEDLDDDDEDAEEDSEEEDTEEGFDEEALIQEMKALGIDPDAELVEGVKKIPAGKLRETAVQKMAPRTIAATSQGGSGNKASDKALAEKVASAFPNPIVETK